MNSPFSVNTVALHSLAAAIVVLMGCATEARAEPTHPNVVVIYADDTGYGEVQALNPDRCKVPTPHLNRLMGQGRVFTDAHASSSVCTPSRYALLTGRYSCRTSLQSGVLTDGHEPLITQDRLTLGRLFQLQGYQTAIVGKWHLGYRHTRPDSLAHAAPSKKTKTRFPAHHPIGTTISDGPVTRGFDTFLGFHYSRTMSSIVRDDRIVEEIDVVDVLPRLTEEATTWIAAQSERAESGDPFFLYSALSSPHTPIVPAEAWVGKTEIGRYGDFVAQGRSTPGKTQANDAPIQRWKTIPGD